MSDKQAGVVETSMHSLEPQAENYEHFCRRVGIWPMNTPSSNAKRDRPAKNTGTYAELIKSQKKTRAEYYTTASVINIALFAQILIAAAVTAVSATAGPGVAITVLGALNTVLAASLTWVKGQGLPDRLLSYANELRRVREHIEDLERQYEASPDFRLDVNKEAKEIYHMYNTARKNAEEAYVGTFKTVGGEGVKGKLGTSKEKQLPKDSTLPLPGPGGDTQSAAANGAIGQRSLADE
jgi:Niemann-Pick C1 protein